MDIQKELAVLINLLSNMDNDPEISLYFHIYEKKKSSIIDKCLHKTRHIVNNNENCVIVDINIHKIKDIINERFNQYHNLQWPSHLSHFHTNFKSYVSCPVTCLYEVIEFLEKLEKEIYGN